MVSGVLPFTLLPVIPPVTVAIVPSLLIVPLLFSVPLFSILPSSLLSIVPLLVIVPALSSAIGSMVIVPPLLLIVPLLVIVPSIRILPPDCISTVAPLSTSIDPPTSSPIFAPGLIVNLLPFFTVI